MCELALKMPAMERERPDESFTTWSSMSSRRHDARPPAAVIAATVIRCSAVESST